MKKLQLIDTITIGIIQFEAYIVEDENKLEAFAIYFQDDSTPILLFKQNVPNEKVEITINEELLAKLQLLKSKDETLRKKHYKAFKTFVLEAEQKAKEIAFKDTRLKYISDVQLIKTIEQTYLQN